MYESPWTRAERAAKLREASALVASARNEVIAAGWL